MPAPTLATFTERSGDLAFIYWGGTSTSGTLLGQVLDFSYTTNKLSLIHISEPTRPY